MSDDSKAEFGDAGSLQDQVNRRPVWSDDGDAPFDVGDDPEALESEKPITAPRRRKKAKQVTEKKSAANETVEIIKTIVFALLIALVVRVLFFQPFTIPSASMEPNLYEGDYIVVSKWSYGFSKYSIPFSPPLFEGRIMGKAPARGDIAVFKLPRDPKVDYIKRVIGLPGDKVQMLNGKLYINGTKVDDVVVSQAEMNDLFGSRSIAKVRETIPGGRSFMTQDFGPNFELDNTPVFEVPQGHYFMMGDNRDNSIDSRVERSMGVGMVPEENLVGKAQMILFSWSPGASLFNPVSWFTKLRPSRFFQKLS
ncbi:signal peptidase I [uncultured Brevundimonas sp.]|uniref:signal peptidase I n=1 Tax=uncultured Brevundimonas sp. TaxID=213418 RepID=UPI00261F0C22|nr:signal peptidase I [uncultured Brevundimonas sp.]